MANPRNTTNLTLPLDTYTRLKKIKEKHNWSYNEVVDVLCELEFKNNYIERIYNYELFVQDDIFKFRITFRKDDMVVEYYNEERGTFSDKIKTWGLPKKVEDVFFEFIREEGCRCILINLPVGLIFEGFDIYKVG